MNKQKQNLSLSLVLALACSLVIFFSADAAVASSGAVTSEFIEAKPENPDFLLDERHEGMQNCTLTNLVDVEYDLEGSLVQSKENQGENFYDFLVEEMNYLAPLLWMSSCPDLPLPHPLVLNTNKFPRDLHRFIVENLKARVHEALVNDLNANGNLLDPSKEPTALINIRFSQGPFFFASFIIIISLDDPDNLRVVYASRKP